MPAFIKYSLNLLKPIIRIALFFLAQTAGAEQTQILFLQHGTIAEAVLDEQILQISFRGKNQIQRVALDIPAMANLTSRQIKGQKNPDIEIWHLDEGMGTYAIHRLFAFDQKTLTFIERTANCGDAFVNLLPQGKRADLVYSVFDTQAGAWQQCRESLSAKFRDHDSPLRCRCA
ncbi:MAG: hypothetical protein LBF16_08260 [Pseudomonadales bacterium]|jgi:hypothetical protein|nr:hypothetical protein [Pseudomonadales bacterium]